MPRYEVKCPKCKRTREIFTLSIGKMTTIMSDANRRIINEAFCKGCDTPMEIVIFPARVDMEGTARKT